MFLLSAIYETSDCVTPAQTTKHVRVREVLHFLYCPIFSALPDYTVFAHDVLRNVPRKENTTFINCYIRTTSRFKCCSAF